MPPRPHHPSLTVRLVLPVGFEPFVAAQVRARLIDIGLADATAPELASVTDEQVPCEPGGHLELVLQPGSQRLAAAHSPSVQVHISRDGGRAWSKGDLATTQSWPVPKGATSLSVRLSMI